MAVTKREADREARSFGLLVGAVMLCLGLWWVHRGRFGTVGPALAWIGGALILAGAIVPRALAVPYRAWMAFAEGLSFVMTRVILLIVFALVLTPIGVVRRVLGADPLRRRTQDGGSRWQPYPSRHLDSKHYERMF